MKTVGIVGGLGPEASNTFCQLLIENKSAKVDQDHIPFIHFCNPNIPDRTSYILNKGKDPTPELVKTCATLENAGADILVIPCNTAHYFLPRIQDQINTPIVDMTKILVREVLSEIPPIKKIGLLATTGSIKAEIYQKYFKSVGVETIILNDTDQEELVVRGIYSVKAGEKELSRKLLLKAAERLREKGAQAIVFGCTEIPLAIKQEDFDIKIFDPLKLTAKKIVDYVESQCEKEEVITIKYKLEDFAKEIGKDVESGEVVEIIDPSRLKVGILHHDLEDQEISIHKGLIELGINAKLYDVRHTSVDELSTNNIIINRVFASVANRNYKDNLLALEKLNALEKIGIKCINSHYTTECDYSKYLSAKRMADQGVPTPDTYLIKKIEDIEKAKEFANKHGIQNGNSIVLKRDIGGRGKDIHLIKSMEELENKIHSSLTGDKEDNYQGGYILQEFVKSVLPHDYRVSMVNNNIIYSMTRSFISNSDSGEKWIASMSLGSEENTTELPKSIKDISLKATKTIGALFNDCDVIVGKNGPCIIENNPTPNFAKRRSGNKSDKEGIVLGKLFGEIMRIAA